MMRLKLLTSALSLSVLPFIVEPSPTKAQVTVQPLVVQDSVQRGKASGILTVANNTNKEFRARVYAEPFTYDRDTGFEVIEKSDSDLTPYLVYAPRELIVPANTTRRVRYIVRFPPNHTDGEFRAVIFTETLEEQIGEGGDNNFTVSISNRIGTALYIRSGDLVENLTVKSTKFDPKDNAINVLFHNDGNATARPKVTWQLKQGGQVIKSGQKAETTVLPNSDRYVILPLEEAKAVAAQAIDQPRTRPEENKSAEPSLSPGTYQLSGEATWSALDKSEKMTFEMDLVVP